MRLNHWPFIMFDKAFESLGKAAADTRLKFEQAAARSRAKLRIDHINQQIRIMHNKISTLTVAMLNMMLYVYFVTNEGSVKSAWFFEDGTLHREGSLCACGLLMPSTEIDPNPNPTLFGTSQSGAREGERTPPFSGALSPDPKDLPRCHPSIER